MLTVAEVAERLRVSEETVRRRIHDGTIRAVSLGRVLRVSLAELERLLDSHSADVSAGRVPSGLGRPRHAAPRSDPRSDDAGG